MTCWQFVLAFLGTSLLAYSLPQLLSAWWSIPATVLLTATHPAVWRRLTRGTGRAYRQENPKHRGGRYAPGSTPRQPGDTT